MPRFENQIEQPFAAEAAGALGHAGRKLRKSLDALHEYDAAVAASIRASNPAMRADLVARAAELFWGYVVQRELLGLLDADYIREQYVIPEEVSRAIGPRHRA